ncbi:hypothetical protein B5P44_01035 [Mycobacterium sp. CBMA 213]|uniref:hypothetical protein n=1 Tax=Mycolicibacterium sp. CBMA 213 TaxID=1968788 RepID=UPI00155DD0A1|nr:hypothetical protein [Mycolicibacterium sp. CBMA 213]MUM03405.1 hypothetical protein [Mycolicibacterium sp. CBMA 213]
MVPATGGIRNESATACGRYAYNLDGPHVPAHVLRAAADPRTPVCKRCVAAVGPMPEHSTRDNTSSTEPVDEINALAALIHEIDGNHTLGAAALAEALVDRGVTLGPKTR